jgi:pyrroline-5-carboxylate reductase
MTNQIITIIGAGNMGASLLGGLIKNGYSPKDLWITDPDEQKLSHLQEQFKVNVTQSNEQAVKNAKIIILAVKPQILADVATSLQQHINDTLIISIAAGIPIASLEKWLGANTAIVRCMPNTPALISCGATGLYANKNVTL